MALVVFDHRGPDFGRGVEPYLIDSSFPAIATFFNAEETISSSHYEKPGVSWSLTTTSRCSSRWTFLLFFSFRYWASRLGCWLPTYPRRFSRIRARCFQPRCSIRGFTDFQQL